MKKRSIIALVILLCLSLTACGRRNDKTDVTILPTMDPTIGTNVPDPSVEQSMPMYTDGTESTNNTANPDTGSGATTPDARRGF